MAKTTTTRLGQTRWSAGTDTVRRLDFDTDAANLESLTAIYGQGLLSARPTAGKAGRLYAVTGEGSAPLNGRIYYDNGTAWTGPRFLSDGYSEASAAGNTALTVKGATSQTVDILKVTNSSETSPFIRVTSSGVVSNQSSLGVTGGFYLGFDSTHDAAASLISVGAAKPVLTLKAATSQTASLLIGRDSSAATVFSVSPAGDGLFAGSLQTSSLTVTGSASIASVTTSGSVVTKNLLSSPIDANGVAATFAGFSSHLNNIVAFTNSTGARLARVSADGTIATNTRVVVGSGQGDLADPSYASGTASLWVKNSYPSAAVARFVGNDAQSGNLFELASGNSGNPTLFSVDSAGATVIETSLNVKQSAFLGASGSPSTFYGTTYQPKFEINTGNTVGAYTEGIVLRHPQQDSTVTTRSLGIYFKMSDEASTNESGKWAGISAISGSANAAAPALAMFAGGIEQARFNASGILALTAGNSISIPRPGKLLTNNGGTQGNSLGAHWELSSTNYAVGIQNFTMYHRATNFAWFAQGVHNDAQFNPGSGGATLMTLTSGSDVRLTTGRLTLTDVTVFNSTTPALYLGADAGHMQFSASTISVFTNAANTVYGTLNLQNGGGILSLGSTATNVNLPSRVLFVGSNAAYFGGANWGDWGYNEGHTSNLRAPTPDDWWFDSTTETIKVRTNTNVWKTIAA